MDDEECCLTLQYIRAAVLLSFCYVTSSHTAGSSTSLNFQVQPWDVNGCRCSFICPLLDLPRWPRCLQDCCYRELQEKYGLGSSSGHSCSPAVSSAAAAAPAAHQSQLEAKGHSMSGSNHRQTCCGNLCMVQERVRGALVITLHPQAQTPV